MGSVVLVVISVLAGAPVAVADADVLATGVAADVRATGVAADVLATGAAADVRATGAPAAPDVRVPPEAPSAAEAAAQAPGSTPAQARGSAPAFRIVVHASNPATAMAADEAAGIFLKRIPAWRHGVKVLVVDQAPSSPVRQAFSAAVFGRPAGAVEREWEVLVDSGFDTPPPVRATDAQVLDYVQAHPGAVGYVSFNAALPSGVKALGLAGRP